MGSFTFAVGGTGNLIDRSVYANTPDNQLTYTGNDSIVWDRVNSERLRRGLPSLTTLGYPRPPEETAESVSNAGQTFTVKGPPGLTRDQAFEIFQKQQQAGSLVGLKPGATISSASQALDGVPGALGQLGQGIRLPGVPSVPQLGAVTNGITAGDFAKTAPALASIGSLDTTQARAAVSQASKLVAQNPGEISDIKGLGQYGLDTQQLERAGYVKPGTAARYLTQDANSTTEVLNSPTVWTGKDGINNSSDLLASPAQQQRIQQDLMSQGLGALREFGAPVDALGAVALAGTLLNAAKDPSGTLDWIRGNPLSSITKTNFDITARDAAFAVGLSDTKLTSAMTQVAPGTPVQDTVDRQTVDAAANRVVGNEKVPPVSYSNAVPPVSGDEITEAFGQQANNFVRIANRANEVLGPLQNTTNPDAIVDGIVEISYLIGDLGVVRSTLEGLLRRATALEPPKPDLIPEIEKSIDAVVRLIKRYNGEIQKLKEKGVRLVNG